MQMRYSMAMGAAVALAAPAFSLPVFAADANLKLELPRLNVAEYHRPYVAVWVEKAADQAFATNLSVWYDLKKKDNAGTKWLKDMRSWWRKSGRELDMPVDGVSAATRAPGEHAFGLNGKALAALPAGSYQLVVEAARENGGREVVRLPFDWPVKAAKVAKAHGEGELGAVTLELKP